jgi:hypothetical protein
MPASSTTRATCRQAASRRSLPSPRCSPSRQARVTNCLLVISLPASDTAGFRRTRQADDVEVGGIAGREALDRLRNVVGRVESSWRPASAEEGFEIVRRRLFEPLATRRSSRPATWWPGPSPTSTGPSTEEFPIRVPGAEYEKRSGRLPDPPGGLRPPLHRLVDAGEVPAHARRAAPDGGRDPQPLGEGRPQPADPAGEHPDRRPARAVRADPLPLGQLGAGPREGRRRPQLPAAAARPRGSQPRQATRPAAAWRAPSTGLGADARRPTGASRTGA